MTDPKKCAHAACNCIAPAGKKYCSQHCEDVKDVVELVCQCCHDGCKSESLKA